MVTQCAEFFAVPLKEPKLRLSLLVSASESLQSLRWLSVDVPASLRWSLPLLRRLELFLRIVLRLQDVCCSCLCTCLPRFSSLAVSAAVAHTHASILHGACHNSWSDTGSAQGPRVRVRPKNCVLSQRWRQGSIFGRPEIDVRGQVAGPLPRRQPGTGTRSHREGAVTPSLHPEVEAMNGLDEGV